MKTNILQDYILKSFENFKNNKEEEIIEIILHSTEKLRLASLIAYSIPSNPDMIIDNVLLNVLSFYTKEELEQFINQNIKFLLKQYLVNKITPEQQLLLIFYVILNYKMNTKKSFTLEFKNVQDYFESYILYNKEQLIQQIEEDKIVAITKKDSIGYIRFTSNNTMVPTLGTKENFINYLYNIN